MTNLGYTLDEEFCNSVYGADKEIDLRYDCYERIGLPRRKDRNYCDIKYQKKEEKIFECVDYFNLPKGGEYCHFTYSWDNQYEELYQCLAEQGMETHAGYCELKHKYDEKVDLYQCLNERFGIEQTELDCPKIRATESGSNYRYDIIQ